MFRSRKWLVIVSGMLIASLAANTFLLWMVKKQHIGMLKVRLDPTDEIRFVKLNAEQAPVKPGEKRVVFAGASRIDMWESLPKVAGCQMVNRGQSHNTSAQLRLRLERDAIALKPDVVFLEVGVNDLKTIGLLPDFERTMTDRLKANRSAMIERLNEKGIHVIVSTIFPFGDVPLHRKPFWSDRTLTVREEINREVRELKGPLITVFDADPVFSAEGRMKAEYQLDEFHLNAAGYEALNRAITPMIEKIVR
ncbi:MAG: hypothetical protein K8T89_13215 [Planctomycetes bacterium]|nr:hypothetical protein [Planctomycetota bacterium]